ncbi:BadF/BadG/BcrA/BcrD ATPase family protein [Paenibacillus sp. sgz500958]|uniref:BadF/BadG/BcrA/BcrD ATPase family protein n=1 Tax=Paenibacillus sp. sgz500958 TaxID=3242475 RepID=UPI0036D301B6
MQGLQDVIIGIDGGGTHTRVMVSDLKGNVLSYLEKGAASVYKDLQAQHNVSQAITEALSLAHKGVHDVRGLAAGIAGYDSEEDLAWVKALTDIDGLHCPMWHFNDAVSAHYGALLARPGIAALSGTGSIILAITEDGRYLRNYDFHHYTRSSSRYIAYDAVFEVLAGNSDATDIDLVNSMLSHWNVGTIEAFYTLGRNGFLEDRRLRERDFEKFTPRITEAALAGSSIACRVSDRAIHQLKIGIELLAPSFSEPTVSVAFTGSVINSPYFKNKLTDLLSSSGSHKQYELVQPRFSPVTGSVLYAIHRLIGSSAIDEELLRTLYSSIHARQS